MAHKVYFGMDLAAALVAVLLGLASAQSGCTSAIISLAPCLSYITGNVSTPSASCCSQLASALQSQPACLCSVLNGGASSFGVTVNQSLALAMPAACKVQTPPVSACNATAGPSKSPVASSPPPSSANSAPANPSTTTSSPPTAEGGSKSTPASISGEGSCKSSLSLMFSIISVAASIIFTKS